MVATKGHFQVTVGYFAVQTQTQTHPIYRHSLIHSHLTHTHTHTHTPILPYPFLSFWDSIFLLILAG